MADNSVSVSGGVGFFGLLTIVLIALKLLGVIGWSWWWVISPLFAPLVISLSVALLIFLLAVIVGMAKDVYRMIFGT